MAIFNSSKKKSIKKVFDALLEHADNCISSNKVIKNIAILADEDIASNHDLVCLLEEVLGFRNSRIYIYRPFKKENIFSVKHFSEDVFSKNGAVLDIEFKNFLNHPFDLLVTYFDKKNIYLEFATLFSKADYKVGFSRVNKKLFDLEIASTATNINEYHQEIKKYLTILHKLP